MFKRQSILVNEGLQLAVDRKGRGLRSAGAPNVLPPGGELIAVSQNLERGSSEVLERQGTRIRASWLPENAFTIENTSNGGDEE